MSVTCLKPKRIKDIKKRQQYHSYINNHKVIAELKKKTSFSFKPV